MEQMRISAKNLGELALPDFCPRCFWIKLRCEFKLPYQIFPGIFSSIDSYSKKITAVHFDQYEQVPSWFTAFGELGRPVKVPHYSKFCVLESKAGVILTGVPDEIFYTPAKSYFIVDYKTAKFTGKQDELLPMYDVQLNVYAYIGERVGFNPVTGLGLVYYEPLTDVAAANLDTFILREGFSMHFEGKLLRMDLNPGSKVEPLLARAREIFELPQAPAGTEGCRQCGLLERLLSIVK